MTFACQLVPNSSLAGVRAADIHFNFMRPLALQAFHTPVKQEQPDVLVTGDIDEADRS